MKKQVWCLPMCWQNFFVGKDVFQIPFNIKKQLGYKTTLCFVGKCFKEEKIKNDIDGIEVKIFKNYILLLFFLFRNVRKIDLFGTFHLQRYSIFLVLIYRFFNKKGKIICKGDFSENSINNLVYLNKKINLKKILNSIDIIIYESLLHKDKLLNNFLYLKNKLLKVSNGFSNLGNIDFNLNSKKNRIILIGHIGNINKNHLFFLKVLEEIQFSQKWEILFVGKIFNNFDKEIEKYNFGKNIDIVFTGAIYDKKELYGLINSSKIFCHTSNNEGDPLVIYEAMYYGSYCVSTDVGTIKENYYKNFSRISKVGDLKKFVDNLNYAVNLFEKGDINLVNKEIKNTHLFCKNNFLWEKTSKNLINVLKKYG